MPSSLTSSAGSRSVGGDVVERCTPLSFAISLSRASKAVEAQIGGVLRPLGLGLARWQVLALIAGAGRAGAHVDEIARSLGIHHTTAGETVSRLEAQGLLTTASGQDRRRTVVLLTTSGEQRLDLATECLTSVRFDSIGLDLHEILDVATMLDKLSGAQCREIGRGSKSDHRSA